VHLEFGRHFGISCLATLVLLFHNKKSIKVKIKIGRKYNQKKLEHLKTFVKKIAIPIYPPF
jgi:hypothetical protein